MSHDVSEASVSKEFHNRNGLFDWANSFSNRYIPVGSAIEPKKTTQGLTASEVLPFAEKNWDMCLSTESSSKGRIGSSWIPVTYEYGHELEVYALSKNHTQISCLVLYPMKSRSRKGLYFFLHDPIYSSTKPMEKAHHEKPVPLKTSVEQFGTLRTCRPCPALSRSWAWPIQGESHWLETIVRLNVLTRNIYICII